MDEDYVKRSDVLKFSVSLVGKLFSEEFDIKQEIQNIPSADVVEVVRCKDCSHSHKTSYPSDLRICLTTGCFHSENHFCSDGKRMDGRA